MKQTLKKILSYFGKRLVSDKLLITDNFGVDYLHDIGKILENKEFNCKLSNHEIETVFDIGANVGFTTETLNKTYPKAKIYAFEPVPDTFKLLQQRTNGIENIEVNNFGFGDKNEVKDIFVYSSSLLSSVIEESPMMSSKNKSKTVKIKLTTLDSFCEQNNISNIDLLKIDTEGFDYNVLKGATRLLEEQKISFIYFEFFYVGDDVNSNFGGRLIEIHELLSRNRYRPISFYTDFVHHLHIGGGYNALYFKWN